MAADENSTTSTPISTRLDINSVLFKELITNETFDAFILALATNSTVETIHLSATGIDTLLTVPQLEAFLHSMSQMQGVKELFCFQGNSKLLTEDRLSLGLPSKSLTVLMLWQMDQLPSSTALPAALRGLHNLQRLTIKVPPKRKGSYKWGCMDVYAMAVASLPRLQAVQCKCVGFRPSEPLFSPEGFAVLLSSQSINTLYLENSGMLDEHMDVMVEELPHNTVLQAIDLQENHLSDDALYSTGRLLPKTTTLKSLNLSGVRPITSAAGIALVDGLEQNRTLIHLELEGTAERYRDEFSIPASPHAAQPWFHRMDLCLRLNRAYAEAPHVPTSTGDFCKALNAVSDHASGLFHFVRGHPKYAAALSPMMKGTTTTTTCVT